MKTLQIGDVSLHEKEGGLGRYLDELLRHLVLAGTESHGLIVGRVPERDEAWFSSFAAVSDTLPRRMLMVRRAAMARLHATPADLIAAHFAPYALPLLDRLGHTPLVVHFHGPWSAESGVESASAWTARAKAMMETTVYRRARRLVVLSEFFRQDLVQRFRVDEADVRVVPGGIDTERFNTSAITRAQAREQLDWPADRFILLAVRRQVRRMGLEELIDAMRIVSRSRPEALLMLAGTGPITAELKTRIAEHGLTQHVRLLGRVDESLLPAAYRAADLSVVPSRSLEGFGLVTLESLASGTPVFVTAVGGLPEVIAPFAPSCIFTDGSAQGMAAQLQAAISGTVPVPGERACRDYAVRHYGWPAIAERVRGVYQEAIA